jgi:hypothetical protein
MWPPGYNQGNAFNQIYTYRTIRQLLKGKTERIVPGHDPDMWQRHTTWITENGNQVAEVNLRDGDASQQPRRK